MVIIENNVVRDATQEEIDSMTVEIIEFQEQPTQLDRIEAQVMFTALKTDSLLEE